MNDSKVWIDLIIELQSLAQAGLTYGKDAYDLERDKRIREISAEMMASSVPMRTENRKSHPIEIPPHLCYTMYSYQMRFSP